MYVMYMNGYDSKNIDMNNMLYVHAYHQTTWNIKQFITSNYTRCCKGNVVRNKFDKHCDIKNHWREKIVNKIPL